MRNSGRYTIGLAALTVAALVGCERADPRLEQLSVGIAKDSVVQVMGAEPQRTDPVLINGQYIETLYFPRSGAGGPEATADRNMTPVVAINQKVVGWGWGYLDSVAAANHLDVAPKP